MSAVIVVMSSVITTHTLLREKTLRQGTSLLHRSLMKGYSSNNDGRYFAEHHDDDDEEMVGLISPRTQKNKRKLSLLRNESKLRPLQILHNTRARSLLPSNPNEPEDPLVCRVGCCLVLVALIAGGWWWSGYEISTNSVIQAWHSYRLRDIQHWCLDPESTTCDCANPLEPRDRIGHKTWEMAHIGNKRDALNGEEVDIVFLGDSITEGWRGTSFGKPTPRKKGNIKVFDSLFRESKGGDFEGLALGIAGDRSPNLLWRIQNGEVPDTLQPSVWWITIGTNDFLREDHCSAEVVLMGIKRVVEEMRKLRPGSIIVVNSILPRSEDDLRGRLFDKQHPERHTVYEGILQVNQGLRKYCEKFRHVVFFDATSIFLKKDDNTFGVEGMYIPSDLMEDYLHPSPEGYQRWGTAINLQVHQLIDAKEADQGRKPLPHSWWQRVQQGKTGN